MAFDFSALGQSLLNPLVDLWHSFLAVLPGLIAALLILLIGYIVSGLVGIIFRKIFEKAGLDNWVNRVKLKASIGGLSLSSVIGTILKWYVFIVFLGEAVKQVNLGVLTVLLTDLVRWLPKLIVAVIIMIFGLMFADFIAVRVSKAKIKAIKLVSLIIRLVIIFFIAIIALSHIGINISIAQNTFLILVGAFSLAIAIAFGIGFGYAMKLEAKNIIKFFKRKI